MYTQNVICRSRTERPFFAALTRALNRPSTCRELASFAPGRFGFF